MTNDWIADTWTRVVETTPSVPLRRHPDDFARAVDTWWHTCEIILVQADYKSQGAQWDNRRARHA